MTTIKLIVSDIDGTILDQQHQISPRLKATLTAVTSAGTHFVLASARSPKGMEAIARELALTDQPLACYNGALILKNAHLASAEPLFSHPMDPQEVMTILQEIQNHFPTIAINLYSGSQWYVPAIDPWIQLESAITKIAPTVTDLLELVVTQQAPVHKFLLIGEAPQIQALMKHLGQLSLPHSDHYLSKENYLEITHKGITKATVIDELTKYFQLTKDATMAIGDNYNDIPMFQAAGLGIAMGNAPIEVQQAASAVTSSNQEDGVAAAIEKYVGPSSI